MVVSAWRPAALGDLLLCGLLLVAVGLEAWRQWPQLALGIAWSGLVVVLARWRPGWALLVGAGAVLFPLAQAAESEIWPALVAAVAGLLAGRRMARTTPAAAIFAGVGLAGLVAAVATGDIWTWLDVAGSLLFFGVLPWLAGRYARLRVLLAAAGWQRAEQLERERRLVAREARLRERTRIAQDMHDSLGHELSLIAMRAGALELDPGAGERYRSAATELRETAVNATERLRDIVGVLRHAGDRAPVEPAGENVADLVARSRASGLDVDLHSTGVPEAVPPVVDRTAYRVVQEALTNAAKHAPGAPVTVELAYGGTGLTVTVTNGPASTAVSPAVAGSGLGLPGLRERVRLVGGSLHAGPPPLRQGYEVVAKLPYAGVAADGEPDDGTGAGPDAEVPSESARHLARVRGETRRGLAVAAAVPAVIAIVVLLVLLGARWYEVTRSYLDPAAYDTLRIGQQRSAVAGELPRQQVEGRPGVPEPAVPPGARCEYYRVTRDMFRGPIDVYRLCFADGRLVDKALVPGQPG